MRQPLGFNDVTVLPPPCLTPQRAFAIYDDAFMRVLEYVSISRVPGDILEFGTFYGYTARTFAEKMAYFNSINNTRRLFCFDSWEGFPEMIGNDASCPEVAIHGTWKKGDCKPIVENLPDHISAVLNQIIPGRVTMVKGYYENTLAGVLPGLKAAVVHIDCDLYESTVTVLHNLLLHNLLQQGTVILFDEFNNNFASDEFGERKASDDIFLQNNTYSLEKWFTYGSSGYAFLVQKR